MIAEQYRVLRDELNYDTSHYSSTVRARRHPAYRKIVDLGKEIVPIILAEFDRYLQTDEHDDFPGHWAMAILHEFTGDDPYENCQPGVVLQMIRAWVVWGEKNGHLAEGRPKYEKPAPIIYKGWVVVARRHGEDSVLCPKREPKNVFEEKKGTAAWVSKIDAARKVDDGWWKKYAWILLTKKDAETALEVLNEKIKAGECSELNKPERAWVEEL